MHPTPSQAAPDRVVIFDTTLRDGEQSPGASMNLDQKLQVARALADLGVDVIEAGFAAASPGDLEAIRGVGRQVEGPIIASLSRCNRGDIAASWEALRDAPRRRCHVFLATSPIHRDFKLKMAKDEIVRRAVEGVKLAREKFEDVEFSAEDSARTELDFLVEVVERAIEAGATTVNIPDTVGYALPSTYAETIRHLRRHVRGIEKAVISVHCHNDLGLAVANSLAGVLEGARQVECTINGIGERAGNASLEEVVMACRTRADVLGIATGIRTDRLYPTSRLVSQVTGLHVQRNKAIVGQNAFAHEAGIHQHGMLTHRETYEIMRPEEVGFARSSLVLGKHSGRHALKERLVALGYQLDDGAIDRVFGDFKILADKKKDIYDADIEALLVHGQILAKGLVAWTLDALSTTSGTGTLPVASVALRTATGERLQEVAAGDGPVDAAFKAIEQATGIRVKLRDYQVVSISTGEDAQGEVSLEVEHSTGVYRGRALSTDIVEGSARAFLDVVNRIALRVAPVESEARAEMGDAVMAAERTPARTLFEKVWGAHLVREESSDTPAVLYVDLHLVHEVTSPQAFSVLRERGLPVRRLDRTLATMDHSTPTLPRGADGRWPFADREAEAQVAQLERNCAEFGVELHGLGTPAQGVVHVFGPEMGATQPGMTVVCGDSHTATHGAFGALAFGIGTSEVGHVLATQCLLQRRPRTLAVRVDGALPPGVGAKDLVLAIIAKLGVGGGTGHVIEYVGAAVRALSMEGRMTLCNMSIEAGARAGMIAPDDTTFQWLAGRPRVPRGDAWEGAVARWRALATDEGARHDREISLDAATLAPMITFGTNPGQAIPVTARVPDPSAERDPAARASLEGALRYMGLVPGQPIAGRAVDAVFVGSCTNGRLEDLREAARILRGRRVAVRTLVVPGSQLVKRQAEAEGLDRVFREAGAEWREPGCSMCIAMNGDRIERGQTCVSTSNRNFEGRQGAGGRTLLASPATAAAAAVAGAVADPRRYAEATP